MLLNMICTNVSTDGYRVLTQYLVVLVMVTVQEVDEIMYISY